MAKVAEEKAKRIERSKKRKLDKELKLEIERQKLVKYFYHILFVEAKIINIFNVHRLIALRQDPLPVHPDEQRRKLLEETEKDQQRFIRPEDIEKINYFILVNTFK